MSNNTDVKYADYLVSNGLITRKELSDRRKVFLDSGVKPHEVERRLEQSLKSTKKLAKALPKSEPWDLSPSAPKIKKIKGNDEVVKTKAKVFEQTTKPSVGDARKLRNNNDEEVVVREKKEKGKPKKEWWEYLMDTGSDLIKHFAPMLLGMGDYDEEILDRAPEPEANSILAASTRGEKGHSIKAGRLMSLVPSMHEEGNVTRICHREYIGDVQSSTNAFVPLPYVLNPGMKETFPWLSAVAANYTSYQFMGLVFEFVSEGSEYTNSAGLGYTALATQYNAAATAYSDKRSMLNSQFADAAKPSKSFMHWIECMPGKVSDPHRLVRSSAVPSGASIVDFDIGKTTLAVGGNVVGGAIIGELWVSYDVLLFTPKSENYVNTNIDFWTGVSAAASSTDAGPLGSGWTQGPSVVNTFTPTMTATTITFPLGSRGRFLVETYFTRTTTTTAASGAYTCTYTNCFQVNGASPIGPSFIAGQTTTIQQNYVEVTADNAVITFTNTLSFFGAGTGATLIVVGQVPAGLSIESEIFDYGGLHRQKHFDDLMKRIQRDLVREVPIIRFESDLFVVSELSGKASFFTKLEPAIAYPIQLEMACKLGMLNDVSTANRILIDLMQKPP